MSDGVIAVVGIEEPILKSSKFTQVTEWVKHLRELGSDKRKQYLRALPRRFKKIRQYLMLARICTTIRCVQKLIYSYNPLVVIIDDKLANRVQYPRKVRESNVKEHHRRRLILLADNLAGYARTLRSRGSNKWLEKVKELEV